MVGVLRTGIKVRGDRYDCCVRKPFQGEYVVQSDMRNECNVRKIIIVNLVPFLVA